MSRKKRVSSWQVVTEKEESRESYRLEAARFHAPLSRVFASADRERVHRDSREVD